VKRRQSTLFAKMALVLLAVVTAVGGLYLAVTLVTTRAYLNEVHQNLQRDLAANLVKEADLMDAGAIRQEALYEVFHMMMVINPAIEVYLLDRTGEILAYSAPLGEVVRERVGMAAIDSFLAADSRLPIFGDDPRDATGRKVFSAAPVGDGASPEGYLYVVLGGQEYDSVVELLAGSYILRLGAGGIVASLLVALAAGLWLFHYLTRRVRGLSRAVESFEAKADLEPDPASGTRLDEGDEIDRLGQSFDRMAERLLRQVEELRHLDNLRRELVANVSHDLRTPLTSLQGYLETLRLKGDSLAPAERSRYLEVASRQAARLSHLVNELFELAKLDGGVVEVHREPLVLGELVQDIVGEYRLDAERRGVTLEAGLPDHMVFVSADTALMARVLGNLIDNALKHTPAGGSVRVGVAARSGAVAVEVADTGEGISDEDLPHLFDRFFYGRRQRHKGDGVGLGLAIARRALELHGATIEVESTLGEGTTVSFELPRAA
jgi:signal transduction histidine kinase